MNFNSFWMTAQDAASVFAGFTILGIIVIAAIAVINLIALIIKAMTSTSWLVLQITLGVISLVLLVWLLGDFQHLHFVEDGTTKVLTFFITAQAVITYLWHKIGL